MLGLCIAWQLGSTCIIQLQSGAGEFSVLKEQDFCNLEVRDLCSANKKSCLRRDSFLGWRILITKVVLTFLFRCCGKR